MQSIDYQGGKYHYSNNYVNSSKQDILRQYHDICCQMLPYSSAMPLKPHELVQIRRKLTAVTPLHPLQFGLHPVPVTFDVLSVNTCHWILEMKEMIHHLVAIWIHWPVNQHCCMPSTHHSRPQCWVSYIAAQVVRVRQHLSEPQLALLLKLACERCRQDQTPTQEMLVDTHDDADRKK